MAAVAAAAVAAATTAFSSLNLSKRYSITRNHRQFLTITTSLSTRSLSSEFTTTFAPPELVAPWIAEASPARLLHVMAGPAPVKSKTVVNTRKKESSSKELTSEPRYSKAARRFYNENFRDSEVQRLSKVLAAAGVASRRSCEELIFEGRVTVNGAVCKTPQTKVDPKKDMIYVKGNRLPKKLPPKVYLALNKPKGYICSAGEGQTKSVISLFDDYMKSWDKRNPGQPKPRLFTVGRLDVSTSGLIIVTNDGEFAQKISHPSFGLRKEYIATIDGPIHKRHLVAISEGTIIDGVHCIPDAVELLPEQPDKSRSRIRIVVHEGRNHEVRELVKKAGLEINSLKRIRIGSFRLPPDLLFGKYIELTPAHLKALGWESEK